MDRQPFTPEDWEIRQLLRQRQLLRAGITEVSVDLVARCIRTKLDTRPEYLDSSHALLPTLTTGEMPI